MLSSLLIYRYRNTTGFVSPHLQIHVGWSDWAQDNIVKSNAIRKTYRGRRSTWIQKVNNIKLIEINRSLSYQLLLYVTSTAVFTTHSVDEIELCINNNNGPNGHLFYVGGDLMMRRGMLPIIMLPDGDLRIVLHLVPFLNFLTIWGSVHIEETVVGWRNQLRMKTFVT